MINRVILTGTIIRSAGRLFRPDGTAVLELVLRFDEPAQGQPRAVGKSGGRKGNEIEVVAFGDLARRDLEPLGSGQRLQVEGWLHERVWRTPEGRTQTRLEIVATDLKTIEEEERRKP